MARDSNNGRTRETEKVRQYKARESERMRERGKMRYVCGKNGNRRTKQRVRIVTV